MHACFDLEFHHRAAGCTISTCAAYIIYLYIYIYIDIYIYIYIYVFIYIIVAHHASTSAAEGRSYMAFCMRYTRDIFYRLGRLLQRCGFSAVHAEGSCTRSRVCIAGLAI